MRPKQARHSIRHYLSMTMALALALPALPAVAQQNVIVVLDDSGSMNDSLRGTRERRMDVAKEALLEVLSQLPPETNAGVVTLNTAVNGSRLIVPLGSAEPSRYRQQIQKIRANGGTPLAQYMKVGADELLKARKESIYGTYRLLIVTDGEANNQKLVDSYLPDILSRGIITDVIGVDMESDHSLATKVHNYRRANDRQALAEAISEVFAERADDDQQAEEDFELIAGLPDGFAEQALQALTNVGNDPIGGVDSSGRVVGDQTYGSPTVSVSTGGGAASILGGLVCCMVPIGMFVVIVVVVSKVITRR